MSHLAPDVLRRLTRGELARDEALSARRHLAECDACSARLDEVEAHREPERTLGRYVLLDELGRGGMGSVVRGFDPQLERFVAVKRLLHAGDGDEARQRLVREAQAMARVVDPHLVAVFDAGLDAKGEVYLVMEFVKGPTLAQWLHEAPRAWREVLALFLQAGKGLVAAHAAGLVHRDFKPGNVLVQDGVAKVTDFGLALSHEAPAPAAAGASTRSGGVSSRVTQAGVNAGTPAYMAPEQFEGRFDAKSDQFSFARSLEESLQGRAAPRWVTDALRRALAVDPAARYPSMQALLDALSLERRARRSTTAWLAAGAVGLLVASVGLSRVRRVDCEVAARPLDQVWTGAAQAALAKALSGSPDRLADSARGAFAQWADTWRQRSVSSCEASASGAQGERVELLRRWCLEQRLSFFSTVLGQVQAGTVPGERLLSLAQALPAVNCSDEELLQTGATDEPDVLREKLQPVRLQLAEVEALAFLGNATAATQKARGTLAAAREVGHGPVVAESAVLLGQRLSGQEPQAARQLFEEAFRLAAGERTPSQGLANLTVRAALELLDTYVAEPKTFEALRPVVESAILRAGAGKPSEAAYLQHRGRALLAQGEAEAALEPLARSYALRLEVGGPDDERTVTARVEYAFALESAGKLDDALAHRAALVESAERRAGPKSLAYARALAEVGAVEVVAVRYADARAHLETASALLSAAGETEDLLTVLDNLASLAELRGDWPAAGPLRAQIVQTTHAPIARGKQLALASRVALELGERDTALARASEAQALLGAVNPKHPDLIVALTTLGRLSKRGEGVGLLEQALALESARDGEYRGDAERAMAEQLTNENARRSWLQRARASYAEAEVGFRVAELDALLGR